ncbi:MAG: hypothetical protein GXP38_09855 [Chloroflexi bacterium]|nr:hypothetical protein [Chloroflexota bacterium]
MAKSSGSILTIILTIALIVIFGRSAAIGMGEPSQKYLWLILPQAKQALVQAESGSVMIPGSAVPLPVEVSDVQQLGAATITLGYDPQILKPTLCQRNPVFEVGLCNLELDRDGDGVADAVRFNVVSLEGVDVSAGNSLLLAEISWEGVNMPGSGNESVLEVQVETFTDVNALPLDVTSENGVITLIPALTPSPTPTPIPLPSPTATPTPVSAADQTIHLPLLTYGSGGKPPVFQWSSWCLAGSAPGLWRQVISSDQAISNWRMRINGQIQENLVKETPLSALAEAPEGTTVYIEALWQEQWLLACKSFVICTQAGVTASSADSFPFASLLLKEK